MFLFSSSFSKICRVYSLSSLFIVLISRVCSRGSFLCLCFKTFCLIIVIAVDPFFYFFSFLVFLFFFPRKVPSSYRKKKEGVSSIPRKVEQI